MFPFQQRDELVFGATTASTSPHDDKLIMENLMVDQSKIIDFSTTTSNNRQLGQTKASQTEISGGDCNNNNIINNIRRVMHRDIERKRRQDLSKLHLSLRTLLPPQQHIKGKRSMCDQVEEAANHIINMQKRIQELKIGRDKMKQLSGTKVASNYSKSSSDDLLNSCVAVNPVHEGFEILITSTSSELGLSKVMAELVERELNVASCISTKTNGMFLHKIEVETTRNVTSLDLSVLRERLTNAAIN